MYSVEFIQIINVLTKIYDTDNKIINQTNNSITWLGDLYSCRTNRLDHFSDNQNTNNETSAIKINNTSPKAKCKQ